MSKPKTSSKKSVSKKTSSKNTSSKKTSKAAVAGKNLIALRKKNVVQWRAIVRHALEQTGSRRLAADLLGVSHPTIVNWTNRDHAIAKGIKLRGRGRPRKTASKAVPK